MSDPRELLTPEQAVALDLALQEAGLTSWPDGPPAWWHGCHAVPDSKSPWGAGPVGPEGTVTLSFHGQFVAREMPDRSWRVRRPPYFPSEEDALGPSWRDVEVTFAELWDRWTP